MTSNVSIWTPFKSWTVLGGACVVVGFCATNPAAGADFRQAARKAVPAVVVVEWHVAPDEEAGEEASQAPELASGTVVSSDGLIVTRYLGEGEPTIMFADGPSLAAKTLVDDERSDLLLLKVEASDLPAIGIAKKAPELAQGILAAVSTSKTERAVAQGIVTAIGGSLDDIRHEILETDVAVGQMSVGAPVVDAKGQLTGIVVAAKSTDAGNLGRAVVIPAGYVQMLLDARSGDDTVVVRRGYMGVSIANQEGPGALVTGVMDDSPASAAGILEGDEIKTIDGNAVSTPHDVIVQIGKRREFEKVLVRLDRDGQPQEVEVTLETISAKFARSRPTPRILITPPRERHIFKKDGRMSAVNPKDSQVRALEEAIRKATAADQAAKKAQKADLAEALKKAEEATDPAEKAELESGALELKAANEAKLAAREHKLQALKRLLEKTRQGAAADFRRSAPEGVPRGSSGHVSDLFEKRNPLPPNISSAYGPDLFEKRTPPRPTIRVERSDTEKALRELGTEMKTLREQFEELREILDEIRERMEEE